MRFAYTNRSPDGQRHAAEIEAESRDAAFARLRAELGIRPIKVTLAGNQDLRDAQDTRDTRDAKRRARVLGVLGGLCVVALLALGAWRWLAARPEAAPYRVMTPQGPVTLSVAAPLPRQAIPGDRRRIEGNRDTLFASPVERLLSHYAEPGRPVATLPVEKFTESEFAACLKEPIRIASTDFTEVVDLKRIVTGMKREMRAYLAGGGTASQYLAELEKRQRLEISYRENAEKRLNEMLASSPDRQSTTSQDRDRLHAVYSYWLKANAQLQAMGIWPLGLPDALRSYQMNLDIEE